MSLKRLAVISAVGSHNSFNNQTISYISSYSGASGSVEQGVIVGHGSGGSGSLRTGGHHQGLQTMRPGANLHGNVNIMLGGAMLSVVITVVCFVCYCCHRNIKKRSNSLYRQQWLDADTNMEIYSVEQCYDPPPNGTSSGGFFMDGSSSTAGDYQSLPTMITASASAINHTTGHHHAQYPSYHQQQHYHQQQQQHHYQYTPYPNGPPPSYDTVVAQDELLASRRKRAYDALPADDTHHTQEEEEDVGQSSSRRCSNHELHECDKQSVYADGATPLLLPKTSRPPGNGDVSVASIVRRPYSDDPDEPTLCRSVVEPDWSEEGDHHRTSCNCPAVVATSGGGEGSIAGPPIYCRNCGYFVATGSPALERRHHRRSHRRNLPIERTRNETLLVDYETPASDVVNRNNVTDDGGTGQTVDTVDIDMRTTMQMVASSSTGPSRRFDTMNNNNASSNSAANETQSSPAASNLSTAPPPQQSLASTVSRRSSSFFGAANSANNNIIIDCSVVIHGDAAPVTGDIIHQCPNTSNQCCNQLDSYLQPGAGDSNGNTDTAVAPVQPAATGPSSSGSPGSLLNENGLVRLDMSQIIDNTGLPTYEAALKLESSGYV
ncbi:uncharacterized protein LOC5667349 isoform X1 [Anopheles gambiae]|uniref:uncharacterized protein LOC5667349 isoform X1 n=2 Tax=Anopheles gambiae TaxID=7165 RepID=UPI002AC9C737|nr:uncharacterized protein LOC5667349 isoform X1 [Anopheles gambiae]XP_061500154.1 uncharacterized protein LOC5667349 isoform X1 [Anopheles gambiae]XP_061500156.1 uncharacterized protein LOC5667349 isoform X1 [Anopheles gambiae]XP_061500157.1 uncharacterized protein LOC5667349 isoform X1 [Anopheles gambiae]XP_061500158.1 uncharacterized protein LOC5667349 isoform X1 [Anopheles gambiae]